MFWFWTKKKYSQKNDLRTKESPNSIKWLKSSKGIKKNKPKYKKQSSSFM